MELVAVAAMTTDRIIATEDGVPWDLPNDVEQYKNRVSGCPVIVGRTTYESMLPDPPGSHHIVLSRSIKADKPATTTVVNTVPDALSAASDMDVDTIYVIGGGQVYDALLNEYNRMVITVVNDVVDPDKYDRIVQFPAWSKDKWIKTRTDESYEGFRIDFWESDGLD